MPAKRWGVLVWHSASAYEKGPGLAPNGNKKGAEAKRVAVIIGTSTAFASFADVLIPSF